MGDDEGMSHLKRFAASGIRPSDAGNRLSPRQKKWYDLYQKIEKCPQQSRGQTTLFCGYRNRNFGFHIIRPLPYPAVTSSSTSTGSTYIYAVIPSSPDETYITPGTPSPGELIGVDCLLRQTGLSLQEVNPDSEETEGLLENLAEEDKQEDEGFEEDHSLDLTFPILTPQP
ncbi:hypothetical protein SRHO_G00235290 [Serrasalmus rhombeus]